MLDSLLLSVSYADQAGWTDRLKDILGNTVRAPGKAGQRVGDKLISDLDDIVQAPGKIVSRVGAGIGAGLGDVGQSVIKGATPILLIVGLILLAYYLLKAKFLKRAIP